MVGRRRYSALLLTLLLAVPDLAAAAQNNVSRASPPQPDLLPAGPFLFGPGAIHPINMDAFDTRPVVKSPDGKLGVTVTGPKESYEAWVTVDPSSFPDGPVQVWPIQRDVDVLWNPDSQEFALTDNRYANASYVLVIGTEFRMEGGNGPGLGIPVVDVTPVVRKNFERGAEQYYSRAADHAYETRLFYAKVLCWTGSERLLIGVSAMTAGSPTLTNRGVTRWNVAYEVDVPHKVVVRELSEAQLLSQYGIKVAK